LEPRLFAELGLQSAEKELSVDREGLLALHPGVRARLLRTLAARLGGAPGSGATRSALEFLTAAASGGAIPLTSDLALRRDLDRITVFRTVHAAADEPVTIGGPGAGEARARVGGRRYVVSWDGSRRAQGVSEGFDAACLRFPIAVRGWFPGDRARLAYGSKKLKKIFLEARVPLEERHRVPVVVDAAGEVLWVPGVVRSAEAAPAGEGEALYIGISNAEPV
jgi:tRNA(Ile)-lysidine synthase